MPAPDAITPDKLAKLIGTPRAPLLFDVRTDTDYAADPRLIPGACRLAEPDIAGLAARIGVRPAVMIYKAGHRRSQGAAAWLRAQGAACEYLAGGIADWRAADLPLIDPARLPARDARGRTLWVTRARPKIDRIACPWLIRRFLDPQALLLFVAPAEVAGVAESYGAAPFDIEDTAFSHHGDRCSFDALLSAFDLTAEPLRRIATIVRGADTARPDLAPQAAGLLAISLGLSRMYSNDTEQLEAGMAIYDALYRWARDASAETHDWPNRPAAR